VPCCYRVTAAGLRAVKAASGEAHVESDAAATEEAALPKHREGRKAKPARGKNAGANHAETPVLAASETVASLA
jgi:hypothetical protein